MRHGRILVVDDQKILRMLLSRILTDAEFEVTVASSAEEALELFQEDPFPLLLTDVQMPGMSGFDLLKKVRDIDPDLVSVVMTAQASLESVMRALRSGAYDYLTKPFQDISQVLRVIHRAREKRKLTDENRLLVAQLKISAAEMQELNRQLHQAATRDGLTSLFNHRYFREALDKEFARSSRHGRCFSIIMMDVDHFKSYNDANGHPVGDLGLKIVAEVLQSHSRASDVAARYGGEEFALLVPETQAAGALQIAESYRKAIEETTFPGAATQPLGRVTVSIGVASFPRDGESVGEVLERADEALYRAKRQGRNQVCLWEMDVPKAG